MNGSDQEIREVTLETDDVVLYHRNDSPDVSQRYAWVLKGARSRMDELERLMTSCRETRGKTRADFFADVGNQGIKVIRLSGSISLMGGADSGAVDVIDAAKSHGEEHNSLMILQI